MAGKATYSKLAKAIDELAARYKPKRPWKAHQLIQEIGVCDAEIEARRVAMLAAGEVHEDDLFIILKIIDAPRRDETAEPKREPPGGR